jgi:TPR repeat protein
MIIRILTCLFLSTISLVWAQTTGKYEVSVMESKKKSFRHGLFSNNVKYTVGDGKSPTMNPEDVAQAIEMFVDPAKALEVLEEHKGRDKGGRIFAEIGYVSGEGDSPRAGDLMVRCGAEDKWGGSGEYYLESGLVTSGGTDEPGRVMLGHLGKWYQFKWASPRERQTLVAYCLSRLPGMPPLKKLQPPKKYKFHIDDASYDDAYKWFTSYPGLGAYNSEHPKFRQAVKCMLNQVAKKMGHRGGNAIVIQSSVMKKKKDTPDLVSTVRSWGEKNQYYFKTGMAIVDDATASKMTKKRNHKMVQTDGIWPSTTAAGVGHLISSVLGDQTDIHMKACSLSAGLVVPDPNAVFPTIWDPRKCMEVSTRSLQPWEVMEIHCLNGNSQVCLGLAGLYITGKSPYCQQNGHCGIVTGHEPNKKKAQEYLQLACDQGAAAGCYAIAKIMRDKMGDVIPNNLEYLRMYKKACRMQPVEACFYLTRGGDIMDQGRLQIEEQKCQAGFMQMGSEMGCYNSGLYYLKQGQIDKAKSFFKQACDSPASGLFAGSCLELGKIMAANGDSQAKFKLKKSCGVFTTMGCEDYYQYLKNQNSATKKIERVLKYACPAYGVASMSGMRGDVHVDPSCGKLGEYYESQNEPDKARQAYQAACDDKWDSKQQKACEKLKK